MATRQGSHVITEENRVVYSWAGLLNGDSGSVVQATGYVAEYTFQVTGTFGAGGSVALQGSNDNVNFLAIDDSSGTPVAATTTKIWRLGNLPRFLKPVVTAGDGTTSLAAVLTGVER